MFACSTRYAASARQPASALTGSWGLVTRVINQVTIFTITTIAQSYFLSSLILQVYLPEHRLGGGAGVPFIGPNSIHYGLRCLL